MPKVRKSLIYKGFSALGKDEVTGSNPVISSMTLAEMQGFCCIFISCTANGFL